MTTSPLGVEIDVHRVRVAEQVVQVAEDFLIGADQERGQIIRLAVELMQPKRPLHVAAVDELIDLAVAVAGDVAQHRVPRRPLVRGDGSASPGKSCLIAQLSGID